MLNLETLGPLSFNTCRHPEMGGVTFREIRKNTFNSIHSHSLHGWQYDTGADPVNITGAANRFAINGNEVLLAIGFYTMVENVNYSLGILGTLEDKALELAKIDGFIGQPGFHLIELERALFLPVGIDFFVALEFDRGGYAFDASFRVYTAMGMMPASGQMPEPDPYEDFYKFDQSNDFYFTMGTITDPPYDVYSKASENESFYRDTSGQWCDFLDYDAHGAFPAEWNDQSWNFAINGYAVIIAGPSPGDCDADQDVDGRDLASLAIDFVRQDCDSDLPCYADFDQDNDVDEVDIVVLSANFGKI